MRKRKEKTTAKEFNKQDLYEEILREAKVLAIPSGAAEAMAEKTAASVEKWVTKRATVTLDDIWRRVAAEAEKYNQDLAYVYKNRGKII